MSSWLQHANFTTQKKRFLEQGFTSEQIDEAFKTFKKLKDKNILQGDEKDIDRFKTFEQLTQLIQDKSTVQTKSEERRVTKVEGAEVVYEDDEQVVLWIKDYNACKYYGFGTKWCITEPKTFKDYQKQGNTFYFVISKTKPKSDPFYKIAVLVFVHGQIMYFDATDTEYRASPESSIPKSLFIPRACMISANLKNFYPRT